MASKDLIQAKFKNISFLVDSETLSQFGQKRIIHDYPNSGNRYAEPQGEVPEEYEVEAIFHGENWKDNFNNFKNALKESSPGKLYLPTFGLINNVVAMPSSATSDHQTLGMISVPVKFTVTIEKPAPTTTDASSEDVFESGKRAREDLQNAFSNNYKSPTTKNNIMSAMSDITQMISLVSKVTGIISIVSSVSRVIATNIKSPIGMASMLLSPIPPMGALQVVALNSSTNAFNSFNSIVTIGNTLPSTMYDIRNGVLPKPVGIPPKIVIDLSVPLWNETTWERKQRNQNRLVSINTFRALGLIGLIEQSSIRTYTTIDDVQTVVNLIDNYYYTLIENDTTNVVIPDMKPILETMKNQIKQVLLKQNVYKIQEIVLEKGLSVSVLCYELYGEYIQNETQLEYLKNLLISLNRSQPAHRLIGKVKVLEVG
jgi:hypothetical protein